MITSSEIMVRYQETDQMGIVHHSNYIRWMEEARIDFLSQIGWDFDKLEEMGIQENDTVRIYEIEFDYYV